MFDARSEAEKLQAEYKPFYFLGMDGAEFNLPNSQLLTGEQIARLTSGDDTLLKEINEPAYEAILKMPAGVGEKLAEAWILAGGAPGKDSSESPETPNDGVPSEETSPPAA